MKIYHFTLFFLVFSIAVISVCENRISVSDYDMNTGIGIDRAFDRACDAAVSELRMNGDSLSASDIPAAENEFAAALCGYFGIGLYSESSRNLLEKIPLIIITSDDGYYIGYLNMSGSRSERKWTDRMDYDSTDIIGALEYYCNEYNSVTKSRGVKWRFELPDTDCGMFQRNPREVGFGVFFQSLYSQASGVREGSFSFASSSAPVADKYYINLSGTGYSSPRYCHTGACEYLNGECTEYSSYKECARAGAFLCPECTGILY